MDANGYRFLRSKLPVLIADSTQSARQKLATETGVVPLLQQFNYPELVMGLLLISGIAALVYGLFGRVVRRQWQLYRLNRRHTKFLKNYDQLSEQLTSFTVSETANQAIIRWKTYMERLDRQPYTSLTTSELAERMNNPQITEALREADRMVYGQTFSPESQEALHTLRDVATQTYYRRRFTVQQSTRPLVEATSDSSEPLLSPDRMKPWYSLHWFSPAQWQQFHIAYPLALFLIPVVLLLFMVRYYLHQSGQQWLNLSIDSLRASSKKGGGRRGRATQSLLSSLRYLLPLSVFLGVSLVLIALSRPQIVREQRDEESEGIDIMLAIDVSASMSETDLPPTRLAAARRVAQTFVNGRKNDRIGLVLVPFKMYAYWWSFAFAYFSGETPGCLSMACGCLIWTLPLHAVMLHSEDCSSRSFRTMPGREHFRSANISGISIP